MIFLHAKFVMNKLGTVAQVRKVNLFMKNNLT